MPQYFWRRQQARGQVFKAQRRGGGREVGTAASKPEAAGSARWCEQQREGSRGRSGKTVE